MLWPLGGVSGVFLCFPWGLDGCLAAAEWVSRVEFCGVEIRHQNLLKVIYVNYRCEVIVRKKRPTFQKCYIDHLLAERAGCCGCHIHNSGLSSTGIRRWAKLSGAPDCRQKTAGARRNNCPSVKRMGRIVCEDSVGKYCCSKVATRISIRALVCQEESFAIATKTSEIPRFHRSMSSEVTTRMKPWCVLCVSDDLRKVFIL
jgi:hypothetical protein